MLALVVPRRVSRDVPFPVIFISQIRSSKAPVTTTSTTSTTSTTTTTTTSAGPTVTAVSVSDGNYQKTCNTLRMSHGTNYTAQCTAQDGSLQAAQIYLPDCLFWDNSQSQFVCGTSFQGNPNAVSYPSVCQASACVPATVQGGDPVGIICYCPTAVGSDYFFNLGE